MATRMNVVVMIVFLLFGASGAWAEPPLWEPDLRWQLEDEYACEVRYFTNVIERTVDGTLVMFVRAHCDDGRAFDAVREGEYALFTLQPCQLDIGRS